MRTAGPLHFYKYDATSNDFVLIDNRRGCYTPTVEQVARLCHRRQGIGADGLILIEEHPEANFRMVYYNADGTQSLCGNGCRAAVDLAARLKLITQSASFMAYDGLHSATILVSGGVRLQMNNVVGGVGWKNGFIFHTGSPQWVFFVEQLDQYNVVEQGRAIRYHPELAPEGVNVNFVELQPGNALAIRTYERGVEDETWSCGTGAVAAALAATQWGYRSPITVRTLGGDLLVDFEQTKESGFSNIFLTGSVRLVFDGRLAC